MDDETTLQVMLARVALDGWDGPACEAFVPDHRWNGWACPVLTMRGVETLISTLHATTDWRVRIDGDSLVVDCTDDDTTETFPICAHDCLGGAHGVDFGTGWTWRVVG